MRSKKKCHRYSKKKKNFSNDYVRMTIITRQACKVIKKKKKNKNLMLYSKFKISNYYVAWISLTRTIYFVTAKN